MAVQGGLQGAHSGGKGELSALLSRRRALWLGMKMQDPALPAECWVSITQRCSITALYLCPSSVSRHYLISDHRKTRSLTESWSVHEPLGGGTHGFLNSVYLHVIAAAIHAPL